MLKKKKLSKYKMKTFPWLKSLWCCSVFEASEKLAVCLPLLPWEWEEDTADNKAINRLDINSRKQRNPGEQRSCKELSPLFPTCHKKAGRNKKNQTHLAAKTNKNILPLNTCVLFHFNYHTYCCGPLNSFHENHRTAEAGRHFWPLQPHCSKPCQWQQVAQGCVLLGFDLSPRMETPQWFWTICSCVLSPLQ